jgi:hypothetical protein
LIWGDRVDMDKELIEAMARAMQRQHAKETLGESHRWEVLDSSERSTWRLIARVGLNVIEEAEVSIAPKQPARKLVRSVS